MADYNVQNLPGLPGDPDPSQTGVGNQDPKRAGAAVPTITPNNTDHSAAFTYIDQLAATNGWTPQEITLAKLTIAKYSGGPFGDASSILAAFNQAKTTSIDPIFNDTVNQAKYALQNNLAELNRQRATDMKSESDSLEAHGLSRSSEAVSQLGSQASVVPFGGATPQNITAQDRFINTGTENKYKENVRAQYNTAEQALGSPAVAGIVPVANQIGGVIGTAQTAKTTLENQTLGGLMDSAAAKAKSTATQPTTPIASL